MSVANLLGDIFSGNFSNAIKRIEDWWAGVTPGIKAFISNVETNEGKILQGLVLVAAKDVLAGGLTTASFVAAAKDVGTQLAAQNITMAQTTIFAALNAEVGNAAATTSMPVPTNNGLQAVPVAPVTAP